MTARSSNNNRLCLNRKTSNFKRESLNFVDKISKNTIA